MSNRYMVDVGKLAIHYYMIENTLILSAIHLVKVAQCRRVL